VEKTCKQIVYGARVTHWVCGRKAGHGPNGDYCKQHAPRNEKVEPTLTLWEVQRRYGNGLPEAIKARSATTNSFIDAEGRRNSKTTEWREVFDTKAAAVEFARKRAEQKLRSAEHEAEQARMILKALEDFA
jgi:hypothetical protein